MEVIRAAKDHQAAEANKNAANLLDELDMEKIREDLKRAAAARKREKKKRKKQEKKQEKRRAESDDLDNESQVRPQHYRRLIAFYCATNYLNVKWLRNY